MQATATGENMKKYSAAPVLGAALALALFAPAAQALDFKMSLRGGLKCKKPEGTIRIVEPDDGQALWASHGLPAPTRMLRVMVTDSNCFTILDRGVGFAAAQAERELVAGGHIQEGANLGGGQMLAADFILIPDLVSQNPNAGGSNVGGGAGTDKKRGLIGGLANVATLGVAGKIAGGMSSRKQTAEVILTITDSRTAELLGTASGEAKLTDRDWNLMASASAKGINGGISAGAYENTEFGKVIKEAYGEAFQALLERVEKVDFAARVRSAPTATSKPQLASAATTSYPAGGNPTATASAMPASAIAAQQALQIQQMQLQMQQMQAAQHLAQQQMPVVPPPVAVLPVQPSPYDQQGYAAAQAGAAPLAGQTAGAMQQGAGAIVGGLAQAAVQQLVPEQMQAGASQLAGAAQLAGQVVGGMQQGAGTGAIVGGLAQAAVQQLVPAQMQAGASQLAGAAQLAGQVVNGIQQGGVAGAVASGLTAAAQQYVPQVVASQQQAAAALRRVLVLNEPVNLMQDHSGRGAVLRTLQPGMSLILTGGTQGAMLEAHDQTGVYGWVPANTRGTVQPSHNQ